MEFKAIHELYNYIIVNLGKISSLNQDVKKFLVSQQGIREGDIKGLVY